MAVPLNLDETIALVVAARTGIGQLNGSRLVHAAIAIDKADALIKEAEDVRHAQAPAQAPAAAPVPPTTLDAAPAAAAPLPVLS